MTKPQNKLAKKILKGLIKQDFYDWYNGGRFEAYITADIDGPSCDAIIKDVIKLFHLDEVFNKD